MIATWMAYCIGISTVLGLTALAVEQVLHERRQPRRWIWTAAILVSAVWAFAPWVLPATPARENASVDTTAPISQAWAWIETLNGPLLFAWLVLSLGSLLGIGLLQARAQRRCRRWRPMRVDDVDALVSKDVGPAVIGLLRGRIVVPEWVLTLDAGDRRLVIAHEQEHLRAADQRLFAVAIVALILTPWNLPLWWQLRRLRQAVEIDCDARVLRGCDDVRGYARLLVDIGQRVSTADFGLAAFAEPTSFLERRIRSMIAPARRSWHFGSTLAAVAALVLFAFACTSPLPVVTTDESTGGTNAGSDRDPSISEEGEIVRDYVQPAIGQGEVEIIRSGERTLSTFQPSAIEIIRGGEPTRSTLRSSAGGRSAAPGTGSRDEVRSAAVEIINIDGRTLGTIRRSPDASTP